MRTKTSEMATVKDALAQIAKARKELIRLLLKLDKADPEFQKTLDIIAVSDALCAEVSGTPRRPPHY